MVGAITPDDPEIEYALDFLWSVWSPERGIGFSSYYSVYDLDDTAACYAVLKWAGYPVNTDVFAQFEEEEHFRCFPEEMNASLSAQVRLVSALRMAPEFPQTDAWLSKVLTMLRHNERNGDFLFDKWHASPYYLTCIAVEALTGIADDLVVPRIKWLLANQRNDGGWGYYGASTPEESAYALMALLWWDRREIRVEPLHIEAAGKYLSAHYRDQHLTPLWLGKCLYTPTYVVRSALLAAVHAFSQWRNR
jgi:halimadienyl-diphosphate synthase